MRRRQLLAAMGGLAATGGLAGCLGSSGGSPPTETLDPTDSGDHPVTPAETSFQVTGRSCGTAENAASVTFGGDSVSVDGVIGGRDSCDTAQLASASLHLDGLEVVVGVVEEPHTETVACAQCLTDIEYAFRASGLSGGPAQVRVVHRTADGEATVTVADRP